MYWVNYLIGTTHAAALYVWSSLLLEKRDEYLKDKKMKISAEKKKNDRFKEF